MLVCLGCAYFLSLLAVVLNVIGYTAMLIMNPASIVDILIQAGTMIGGAYSMLLIFSLAVTISDWSRIRGSAFKKVLYAFTFPLFIFSFIPAAFVAIFKRVEWKQVQHKGAPASQAAVTETSENENELITK